jgi:uncharacterized protein (TIGR02246 family)
MHSAGDEVSGGLLQMLLDERDCAKLVARYGMLADGDDHAAFADLFTPDAIWERPDGTVHLGQAEIQSVYTRRQPGGFSRHLIGNVQVNLVGDQALVRSTAVVLKSPANQRPCTALHSVFMASYEDSLERCPDGQWRIARRSSQMLLTVTPN